MKFKIVNTLIALLLVTMTFGQSTERFIRIVGNSQVTFDSDVTRVYFSVSEVAPNEYKKISYKSIDESYRELIEVLTNAKIDINNVKKTNSELNKYNKTETKDYYVDVKDINKLDALSGFQKDGFKIKDVKYLFESIESDIESRLSFEAIDDAKRKANNICNELDMKLGRILNIEDRSSGCCTIIKESKTPSVTKKYNVNITFELLD